MKKTVIILVSIILYSIGVKAQLPQSPISVLSPNAASLGVYGDIPVSLYTGTPEINIPLYDIQVKDFTLPISLSYHASGVKVDQRAGWTGVNWSLFAGGMITRTVNHLPDDLDLDFIYMGKEAGFYYNHNILNSSLWNTREYLQGVAQIKDRGKDEGNPQKDTAPDEFSFSFHGYSGKFYLDHTGAWKVKCNKPVKVEFDGDFLDLPNKYAFRSIYTSGSYSSFFSGFTIIAEDGARYQFGKNIDAIDLCIDFWNQHNADWIATAWYLTKITLPNKQEINLSYQRNEFNNQMYVVENTSLAKGLVSGSAIFGIIRWNIDCSHSSSGTYYMGKLISPVYLKEITTDNVSISFFKSYSNELNYARYTYSDYDAMNAHSLVLLKTDIETNYYPYHGIVALNYCLDRLKWYKLDSITVKNKINKKTIKTIAFNYNNLSRQRLFLNSVTESGKRPYSFSYSNAHLLPGYLAQKSDHWGYFNNLFVSIFPGYNYTDYYNKRNSNATVLKYGMLTKLTYPTGGYTEFEYEPHYYRKQLHDKRWQLPLITETSNKLAGGVRIKSIKNSSSTNDPAPATKTYYYVTDYRTNKQISSGILGGQIKYRFENYKVTSFNGGGARTMSVFSSFSVLPAGQNASTHIGYTEVFEERQDGSFSKYRFTNFDITGYMDEGPEAVIQETRTPYERYTSKADDRGKLLLQEDHNAAGYKVRSKEIVYGKDGDSNNYIRAMVAEWFNICSTTAISYDEGVVFKYYTYLLRPTSETEKFYDPVSGTEWQSVKTDYTYAKDAINGLDRKLIGSVSTQDSKGETWKTTYNYPFNRSDLLYKTMVSKNILSPVVDQAEYKNNVLIPVKQTVINYKESSSGSNIYVPGTVQFKPSSQSSLETRTTYHNYDLYGNPLYITANDADKTVYLWSYKGQYIVAEIKGATYAEVQTALSGITPDQLSQADAPDMAKVNALRGKLPTALVTTYTHEPLVGVKTITDPRSATTYYEYDGAGRLLETYIIEGGKIKQLQEFNYHYQNQ